VEIPWELHQDEYCGIRSENSSHVAVKK